MHEAVIADQNLFLVQGDQHHYFVWEECGFKLRSYHHTISTHDTCAVRVSALAGGNFIFPEGIELLSAVYAVTISTPVFKDLEIHLQHCLDISDQREIKNVSFAVASTVSSTSGYKFYLVDDERFTLHNEYGSIRISSNACYCIVFRKEHSIVKPIPCAGKSEMKLSTNAQEAVEESQDEEENGGDGSSYKESVAKEQDVHSSANGGEDEDQGSNDESGVGESGEGNSDGNESSDKEPSDEKKTNGEESDEIETTDEEKTDSDETDESSESENEKGKKECMAYYSILIYTYLRGLHNTIIIIICKNVSFL